MEQIKIGGSYICYKEFKITENQDLKTFLDKKNLENFVKSFKKDFIFVLGGDGTMLKAIKKHYKKNIPFFGINYGNKGFFLNPKDITTPGIQTIIKEYSLIEIIDHDTKESHIAVNEIDMRSKNGKLSTFNANISGKHFFSIDGDGIIISTPLGSTGYNISLKGPILLEDTKNFVITPKAAWRPRLFPSIVVNENEKISISNSGRKNPIYIFSDGDMIFSPDETKNSCEFTIQKSKYKVNLAIVSNNINNWNNRIFNLCNE